MTVQKLSRNLPKTIILYSALGVFLTGLTVAAAIIFPLYDRLKQNEERNLLFALKTRTLAAEEYISKVKGIASQIAGRTKAREQLEAYNQGKVSKGEVAKFTQNVLTDAIGQSPEVAGVSRFGLNNQEISQVGMSIPSNLGQALFNNSPTLQISNPLSLNGQSYLVVSAPIINSQSQQVGTDIILFKATNLQRIAEDRTGLRETEEIVVGKIENGEVKLFFPYDRETQTQAITLTSPIGSALEKSNQKEVGIMFPQSVVIAYGFLENINWGILVKINQQKLYEPIDRQFGVIGLVIVGLIFVSTCGLVLLLRPLTGQVWLQASEWERQAQEKATQLAQKTADLQLEVAQRQKIEEVLRHIENLRSSSSAAADRAAEAALAASQALMQIEKGTQAVKQSLDSQAILKETVTAIADRMGTLSEQADKIAHISAIVGDLATQTNMLAINAGVEAVRASEYGKGFAVVASQIRKLADRSNQSATQINLLIREIRGAIQSTATATKTGQETVDAGTLITQGTSTTFSQVSSAVNHIVTSSQQISLNVQQQASAIQQIVDALSVLDATKRV